jgi:hypothetical protein
MGAMNLLMCHREMHTAQYSVDYTPVAEFFCHFAYVYLMSCNLRLTLGRAPIRILILICVSQYRLLNALGQMKAPSLSLAITNGNREKSSGQAHLFNI